MAQRSTRPSQELCLIYANLRVNISKVWVEYTSFDYPEYLMVNNGGVVSMKDLRIISSVDVFRCKIKTVGRLSITRILEYDLASDFQNFLITEDGGRFEIDRVNSLLSYEFNNPISVNRRPYIINSDLNTFNINSVVGSGGVSYKISTSECIH